MKRLLSLLFVLMQCASVWGQNTILGTECKAYLPQILLDNKILKETDANKILNDPSYGQSNNKTRRYWNVCSDREDNYTYKTPGGTEVKDTLGFNDVVRIAQIEGDYALVYKEPRKAVIWPVISSEAEAMGWIHMDNLLLWDTSLANDVGILYKALICRNVDAKSSDNSTGKRYLHPTSTSSEFDMDSGIKFYFVMKRDKSGRVLLATQSSMSGISKQILFGWLDPSSFIPWNQRSCIEPNWHIDVVEYLASKNVYAKIYDKDGDVASNWPFVKKEGTDFYKYRWPEEILRFPILDGTNETTYECSSFGAQDIQVDEQRKAILENKKNINLLIVIDGTESMRGYYLSVYNAIQQGCEYFDRQHYKLQVGVVIYRDYGDGNNGLVEVFPFRKPNDKNLMNFLNKGGEYGIKSVNDATPTEALFYGMNKALEMFDSKKKESNIMLVVGDCGNDSNDKKAPTQQEIQKKFIDNNVNLVSFQVHNKSHHAWGDFNTQMISINRAVLKTQYDNLYSGTKINSKRLTDNGAGFEFRNSARALDTELYFGVHRYATVGSDIPASVLTTLMSNTIKDYASVVQRLIDIAVNPAPVSKEVKESVGFKQEQNWLKKEGLEKTKDLLAFSGTTPKYYNGDSKYPYYQPILFITDIEFDELLSRLEKVYNHSKKPEPKNRIPYINAIKALYKSFVPDLTDRQMNQMGLSALTELIQGLNVSTNALSQYTLLDINDSNKVSPSKYKELLDTFSKKYETLLNYKNGNYKYVKDFNGTKYYWIPVEDLP